MTYIPDLFIQWHKFKTHIWYLICCCIRFTVIICSLLYISYIVHVNLLLRYFWFTNEENQWWVLFFNYLNIHLHYIRAISEGEIFIININQNSTSNCHELDCIKQIHFKVNEELGLVQDPRVMQKTRCELHFGALVFLLRHWQKSYKLKL